MRTAVRRDAGAAAKPGGPALTSVVVLALLLTPALLAMTGAQARQRALQSGPGVRAGGQPGQAAEHARPGSQGKRADRGRPARLAANGSLAASGLPADRAVARAAAPPDQAADAGVQLLQESAAASRALSYDGVQIVSWWGQAGASAAVVYVTHRPAFGTLVRTMGTGAAPGESFVAGESGPGDVLGITEETLDLLAANYEVAVVGTGTACDRAAQIVDARRDDGTIAARFWLDTATKIPLRRELFDQQAQMINESTYIDLTFGIPRANGPRQAGSAAPRPWDPLTGPDLVRLRAAQWPLPAQLPGGLTLFDARRAATSSGQVIELSYSDGLSSVSLFVQRGGLPDDLPGFREVVLAGWPVFARDSLGQSLTWSSGSHVLTLIADAPDATISAAVDALPHDTRPGFWSRMGHGFRRLVSWVNPFR